MWIPRKATTNQHVEEHRIHVVRRRDPRCELGDGGYQNETSTEDKHLENKAARSEWALE